MPTSRPAVPDKWQPAFEAYRERMESALAFAGAWLLLVTVALYHVSHTYFHHHEVDLGHLELWLRLPVIIAAALALINHHTGFPRWPARYFLRLMGLTLSVLALSLLFLFARYEPLMVSEVSDAMTVAFFGATVLGLRSFREWLLIALLPITLFALAAIIADLPALVLVAVFIGPALIMFVTCTLMMFVRNIAIHGFLSREQLNEMATTDTLTGLLNRRAFMELIRQEQARAQRAGEPFSVILADLDKFKRVNDTWGHEAGDDVLKETSARLRKTLRQQDALCRWGGEEFLMLLPGTDSHGAMIVAEKCREGLQISPMDMHGTAHTQTASFGVATCTPDEAIDHLIGRADAALYQAKENGRNRCELASPGA
ncbi:GGDEF domain-containing protein [Marinobacter halophilus]|uniref:diguanylate cyclase n=1 Tax=Marinobacter halophilus TaxID=1323740 RepID=A0A2T1KF64_9GAMM|nr:GGDEF domain-containing protein [Marinobacter halophilus]PSF08766.1 hypothetical protein C7H08_08870 [Marinobacter halophilus]GGC63623.1 hypothetical protein GCM10011362_09990 [Marinobacter halophilus]